MGVDKCSCSIYNLRLYHDVKCSGKERKGTQPAVFSDHLFGWPSHRCPAMRSVLDTLLAAAEGTGMGGSMAAMDGWQRNRGKC